jgi:HD-like signal output (HDOD) protein
MMRVLFVDDEPAVLEGLENRLRKLRRKWRMVFAPGADQALAELNRRDFDVIITDMRMPGMDGAALLRRVRAEYPHVVRIVLSGQTGKEGLVRALPVAHRFLAKPCDAATLEAAVERAHVLQALLSDSKVRQVVSGIERLPTLPRLYQALTDALERPDADLQDAADILEQDLSMTARLLQIVNSAFFGLTRRMTTVRDATAYLGLNAVRSLVLSVELFAALDCGRTVKGFSLSTLQGCSLRAAHIATRLLDDEDEAKTAFSAAMLHDLGTLVLATSLPEFYEPALALSQDEGIPLHEAERRVNGFTHADVGASLLAVWGLPYPIIEAVAFHHHPGRAGESTFGVVGAVHVADRLAGPHSDEGAIAELDTDYLQSVGVMGRLAEWVQSARAMGEAGGRHARA